MPLPVSVIAFWLQRFIFSWFSWFCFSLGEREWPQELSIQRYRWFSAIECQISTRRHSGPDAWMPGTQTPGRCLGALRPGASPSMVRRRFLIKTALDTSNRPPWLPCQKKKDIKVGSGQKKRKWRREWRRPRYYLLVTKIETWKRCMTRVFRFLHSYSVGCVPNT